MAHALLFVTSGLLVAVVLSGVLRTATRASRSACGFAAGNANCCALPQSRRKHPRPLARIFALALSALFLLSGAHAQEEAGGAPTFAFEVDVINEGLPMNEAPLRLDTPRAALESYLDAIRQDDFLRAAYALNLNAIPEEQQAGLCESLRLDLGL